ncbi:MAG: SPOR domain-containing protein [Gammaproteobacteria bacterium]|nr:SPOR domain-containing protein [Gammaproteobacteria bacterium]MCI0591567.1 SPOR domain-containing protein [Gammaproteobacteria bacterium]
MKERLVGAAVLVALAVIFIPIVFDETPTPVTTITSTNIPPKPTDVFTSRIIPIDELTQDVTREHPAARPMPDGSSDGNRATEPIVTAKKDAAPSVLENATVPEDTPAVGERVGLVAWVVQLGSFSSEANAQALNEKLRKSGYASFVDAVNTDGKKVFRVRVGPELVRSDAEALRENLGKTVKLEGIVVRYP